MYVAFDKMSGGAVLGNFSDVKILFTSEVPSTKERNIVLKLILPTLAGALMLIAIIVIVVVVVDRRRRYSIDIPVQCSFYLLACLWLLSTSATIFSSQFKPYQF